MNLQQAILYLVSEGFSIDFQPIDAQLSALEVRRIADNHYALGCSAQKHEHCIRRLIEHAEIVQKVSTSARAMGAQGGAAKTEAKRKAAAENGKKGGRPKEVTLQGFKIAYDAAVNLMDDDLREELHRKYAGKVSEQLFLDLYCDAHRKKFGVDFQVN